MQARDVMMSPVVTAKPYFTVQHVAKLFLQNGISAVPVIDDDEKLIGIVSEGDLMHRAELQTERPLSWWLAWFASDETLTETFIKERSRKVADVMSKTVITISPTTPLNEVADLLEKHRIKRVPVLENGHMVGIVSRASLIQALASSPLTFKIQPSDKALQKSVVTLLRSQPWGQHNLINATATDGIIDLWGLVASDKERHAVRIAAESVQGVRGVKDHMYSRYVSNG